MIKHFQNKGIKTIAKHSGSCTQPKWRLPVEDISDLCLVDILFSLLLLSFKFKNPILHTYHAVRFAKCPGVSITARQWLAFLFGTPWDISTLYKLTESLRQS